MGRVSCSSAAVVKGISAARREGAGRRANCAPIVGPLTAIQRSTLSFSMARAARANGRQELGPASSSLGVLLASSPAGARARAVDATRSGGAPPRADAARAPGSFPGGRASARRGARRKRRSSCPDGRSRRPPCATAAACPRGIRPRRRRRRQPVHRGSRLRAGPRLGSGRAGGRAAASPRPARRPVDAARRRPVRTAPPSRRRAGRGRTLAPLDLALAVLAGSVPGLLAREKLGEDVGRSLPRRALVALGSVTGRAVGAVELDPSVDVLGLRHLALAALTLGIPPRPASQSDALAQ